MCKIIEDFVKEEREEAKKEGKIEGENESKREIALRMLNSKKYPIEEIAELVGLSLAELQKLETEQRP